VRTREEQRLDATAALHAIVRQHVQDRERLPAGAVTQPQSEQFAERSRRVLGGMTRVVEQSLRTLAALGPARSGIGERAFDGARQRLEIGHDLAGAAQPFEVLRIVRPKRRAMLFTSFRSCRATGK